MEIIPIMETILKGIKWLWKLFELWKQSNREFNSYGNYSSYGNNCKENSMVMEAR